MIIKDFPQQDKPREKLLKSGPKHLTDSELIAILLRVGNKKQNVIELSKQLLNKYPIEKLQNISASSLVKVKGIGLAKACQIIAAAELAKRFNATVLETKTHIQTSADFANIMRAELINQDQEQFIAVFLDSRDRILKTEIIFIGSLNNAVVHPREVYKKALEESAYSIIICHNHPSNDPRPSDEDIRMTKVLAEAGQIMGIKLLDHIIISADNHYSFHEKGLL